MSIKGNWTGNDELVAAVDRTFSSLRAGVAVAAVSARGVMTATRGVDRRSTFEIGSLSKPITGMLYRDAVERGLVSTTTVLGELLPFSRNPAMASVTLQSLATHSSGLPSLPPGMHPYRRGLRFYARGENPYGDSLSVLLEQVADLRPGATRPKYSNLGFQLLGHAVARAAGSSYQQLLRDVMGVGFHTPARAEDLGHSDLTGHTRFGRARDAWVGEAIAPAGGIRTTIDTMGGFLGSILNGSARGLSALDPVAKFHPRVDIGAGWIMLEYRGRKITWHNGSTGGFSSWIGLDRIAGTGVVALAASHQSLDRQGFQLLHTFVAP